MFPSFLVPMATNPSSSFTDRRQWVSQWYWTQLPHPFIRRYVVLYHVYSHKIHNTHSTHMRVECTHSYRVHTLIHTHSYTHSYTHTNTRLASTCVHTHSHNIYSDTSHTGTIDSSDWCQWSVLPLYSVSGREWLSGVRVCVYCVPGVGRASNFLFPGILGLFCVLVVAVIRIFVLVWPVIVHTPL